MKFVHYLRRSREIPVAHLQTMGETSVTGALPTAAAAARWR